MCSALKLRNIYARYLSIYLSLYIYIYIPVQFANLQSAFWKSGKNMFCRIEIEGKNRLHNSIIFKYHQQQQQQKDQVDFVHTVNTKEP